MFSRTPFAPALALSAVAAVVSTTACSGGGGGSPVTPHVAPVSTPAGVPTPSSPATGTTAVITIKWPARLTSSATVRRPQYVSDGTKSVTILVDGTTTEVDNPNYTSAVGAPTQATTAIPVAVTPDEPASGSTPATMTTFTVTAYDKTGATGNALGSGTASATIVKGMANAVNITLNGILASIGCAAVAPSVTATGTGGTTFQQVGITGDLALVPKDADGFTIIMPGTLPMLMLTPVDATMASTAATSTQNTFATTVVPAGTPEKFTAAPAGSTGTISTTCTITRDLAMYVSNVGKANVAGQQSITIYDATVLDAAGTTAQAPSSTIEAPAGASGTSTDLTDISEPQFLAVDAKGYLFVTNQGPLPGMRYGPTSGYVAIYAPGAGQSGNVAPVALISGLNRPEGIAFDTAGTLYVMTVDTVYEYPPTANGETAAAVASNKITGSNTDLNSCYGLRVDSAGSLYTACSDVINIFAKGATGNATPALVELPEMTSMSFDSVSWLDVAADSAMNYYAPAANNNTAANNVYTFMAGTTNGALGTTSASNVGFSQPTGIAVDPSDGFYITNFGSSSVDYFASSTTLSLGVADSTLSGTATGLNSPFGVTVR